MGKKATLTVLSILLALIIKSALDTSFRPVFEEPAANDGLWGLPLAQLLTFALLTLRFYLGAYRFSTTEPAKARFVVKTFNFVFAFLVFCAFYVTSLCVTKPEFYAAIVWLHIIDFAWFAILYILSGLIFVPWPELEPGELRIEAVRPVMLYFVAFSAITVLFGFVYGLAGGPIFSWPHADPNATLAHWCFLGVLLLVSLVDFYLLREYFFYFERWKEQHGAVPTATTEPGQSGGIPDRLRPYALAALLGFCIGFISR